MEAMIGVSLLETYCTVRFLLRGGFPRTEGLDQAFNLSFQQSPGGPALCPQGSFSEVCGSNYTS